MNSQKQLVKDLTSTALFACKYTINTENLRAAYLAHTGLDRLPTGVPKLLEGALIKIHATREKQRKEDLERREMARVLGHTPKNKRERAKARLRLTLEAKSSLELQAKKAVLQKLVESAYDECSYNKAKGTWAGGKHTLIVREAQKPGCSGESDRVWSSNGKWSGLDSCHTLEVSADWESSVYDCGIAVVSNLLTLSAQKAEVTEAYTIYDAFWAEQGRGFDLKHRKGVILDYDFEGVGFSYHASSIRGAKMVLKKRIALEKEILAEKKRKLQAGQKRLESDLATYGKVQVTFKKARSVGLCATGIRDFVAKRLPRMLEGLEQQSVSGATLLKAAHAAQDRYELAVRACKASLRLKETV